METVVVMRRHGTDRVYGRKYTHSSSFEDHWRKQGWTASYDILATLSPEQAAAAGWDRNVLCDVWARDLAAKLVKPTAQPQATPTEDSVLAAKNAAMVARDGPAKTVAVPPQAVVPTPLVSSAKPCPFAAFTSPDLVKSDHRIAGHHGSAHLVV